MNTNLENLPRPEVTLTGRDGNAFMLIGLCVQALRRAKWNNEQIKAFQAEAMSGDYDHVLQTCMRYCDVD